MKHLNTIETERLLLLEVTAEAYQRLFRTCGETELRDILGLETEEEWQREQLRYEQGPTGFGRSFVCFYLREKGIGKTIGSCNFHIWYTLHYRAEIGYALKGEEWKRQGYMTEALLPVIRYGFETMELNRIEASTGLYNIASQKLLAALGFRQEGHLREHYYRNGVLEDSLLYGLLRKDFEQQKR